MCHLICCYVVSVLHAGTIKLTKVEYTSTAIIQRDTSYIDTIKALVNYSAAYALEYGVTLWIQGQSILITTRTHPIFF